MCMKFIRPWQKLPRWSLTSKKVYKVMRKSEANPSICYSAHRGHEYVLGNEEESIITTDHYGHVSHGLHTFPYLSDAMEELNRHRRNEWFMDNERPESRFAIYECIVPRGSRYYRGVWEHHWPSKSIPNLVTNRLIVLKEVVLSQDLDRLKAWDEKRAARIAAAAEASAKKVITIFPSDLAM